MIKKAKNKTRNGEPVIYRYLPLRISVSLFLFKLSFVCINIYASIPINLPQGSYRSCIGTHPSLLMSK